MTDGIMGIIGKKKLDEGKREFSDKTFKELQKQALDQKVAFENALKEFASKNEKKIKEDPEFRAQFNEMCLTLGVDPLQSRNGFWSKFLKIGDFYHELAIKTIEVSFRLRHTAGGMVPISKVLELVSKTYAKKTSISASDIKTAIKGLGELGEGYAVKKIKKKDYFIMDTVINDVPQLIIEKADDNGLLTEEKLKSLGLPQQKLEEALDILYKRGIIWKDRISPTETRWYVFSMFKGFN
ncbi:ESCRT-II subunit protein snf8 [Tritrichomonas musculus]|uniref:ESCRT-II subunit protein snf8 n=1 Tax=Tritrichomonas musculus TaxID=1915356 RepID=A0ABR2K9V2_9EUKA